MEKRGSRYLRYALYNAARYACLWDLTFAAYLAKKRNETRVNTPLPHLLMLQKVSLSAVYPEKIQTAL